MITHNPKMNFKDYDKTSRWIVMKFKTIVYKHDQKRLTLTDSKIDARINQMILDRR